MDIVGVVQFSWSYSTWKAFGGSPSSNPYNPTAQGRILHPWANWDNDDCSAPLVDNGPYDFAWACRRHDFGYRNVQRLNGGRFSGSTELPPTPLSIIWTGANRSMIDSQFLDDMGERCNELGVSACGLQKWIYYSAVKAAPGYPGYSTPQLPPFNY